MSGLQIVTEPAREPVTAIEAREHLRLDDDVDNIQVMAYIMAAREWAENYTGRVFITRTLRQFLDSTPAVTNNGFNGYRTGHQNSLTGGQYAIEIAASPVISVTSVKYYNDAGTESTWATSNYYVDTVRDVPRIVLLDGGSWPTDLRGANGLEINFTAGYGSSPDSVPEPIRLAILQYCTFLYEHRGDFEGSALPKPPSLLQALLQPYKIMRFGATPYENVLRSGIG
jgi:hypothetical protein